VPLLEATNGAQIHTCHECLVPAALAWYSAAIECTGSALSLGSMPVAASTTSAKHRTISVTAFSLHSCRPHAVSRKCLRHGPVVISSMLCAQRVHISVEPCHMAYSMQNRNKSTAAEFSCLLQVVGGE